MICEKCGKKVSDGKTYCDYCKNPVVYSGFSRLEYEKTPPQITPTASTAPPVTCRTGTRSSRPVAPQEKKKSSSAPVAVAIVALIAVVAIVWFVAPGFMNKGTPAKNTINPTKSDSEDEIRIELDVDEPKTEETENPIKPYLGILAACGGNDKYMICNIGDENAGLIIKNGNSYKVYAIVDGTAREVTSFITEELLKDNEIETVIYKDGEKYYQITKDGKHVKENYDSLMATKISDSEFYSVSDTSKIDNYNKEK